MKTTFLSLIAFCFAFTTIAQEKKDTTRMNMGKTEIIIITKGDKEIVVTGDEEVDTIYAGPGKDENHSSKAHWSGIDFGFNMLLNDSRTTSFKDNPYWENDPAKSLYINLNIMEHKFSIVREYVGLTTGLGFNFNQVGFKNDYLLVNKPDTLYAVMDTVSEYSKNKLRAAYLQIPLMIEFNTSANEDKSFYLAAGVIGGVRMTSRVKRIGKIEGKEFEQKIKGVYGINPFKLDAAVRLGYADWGAFVNYSLIPLFESSKTVEVYPLSFGLSYNF